MKKRVASLFLTLCLLLSLLPVLPAQAAQVQAPTNTAVQTSALHFGKTIAAGDMHMVVVKQDGSVWSWGYNEGARLGTEDGAWVFSGYPESIPEVIAHPTPVRVPLDKPVISVSAGSSHSAAITSDGELWNWGGHNAYGGLGRETEGKFNAPGKVMDHAKQVANGNLHTAVLTDSGALWTFGGNLNGQIGNGGKGELFEGARVSYPYQLLPVQVLDNVKSVATGSDTTYAIRNNGSLWAWGNNEGGLLGNATDAVFTEDEEDAYNRLLGEYSVVTYRAGEGGKSYAVTASGGLSTLIYPPSGTRDEVQYDQKTPIKIMDGVKQVCAGTSEAVILKEDGTLWRTCRMHTYLRYDSERRTSLYTFAPQKMPLDDVVAVSMHGGSYAAIRSDGSLWTWGKNYFGELGRGKTSYSKDTAPGEIYYDELDTPAKVLDNVVDVAAGDEYLAALKSDGTLWMSGVNGLGQLAGATDEPQSYSFIQVMDGVALPDSYTRNQQTIPHNTLPASFIETAPVQPEGAPVWDTTAWGSRYMSIPSGSPTFNGNTYAFYIAEDCSWDEAENYCLSLGGHLAVITSQEEQDFIACANGANWIGARRNPYGNWEWVTGERWGYQCWAPGENDNYGGYEDALYVGGYWGDASNNATGIYGFVCEWETAGRSLPTPPAPIYSVSFNVQEGVQIDTLRKEVIQGQTYGYLPTPRMTGWNFVGWYDGINSSRLITPSTVVNLQESLQLYAKWTPNTGGPSVPRLSYSFGNNNYDLNYPEGYAIPIDRYDYIYGNRDFSNSVYEDEWGGSCGGFCATASMLYMQNAGIDPSQFRSGAALAGELKIGDRNNALGMTLREWIETVQVSQSSAIIQSQAAKSAFDYNGLVQGVLNFRNNNTEPIIIWIWGPYGQGGHALLGVGVWRKDDRTDRITVYDPNWPNADRYIDLYRDSQGRYCGWYYDLGSSQWGSAYGNGVIQYVRYSDYMNVWNSRGTQAAISGSLTVNSTNASIYDYSGNLVATIRDGQVESLRSDVFPATDVPAGEGSGNDRVTLWVPNEHFMVVNEDENVSNLTVRVNGQDNSVSASTSADRLLVYSGGKDSMALVSGDGEQYEMTFSDGQNETVLSGTTAKGIPSCLASINGQLRSTGVHLDGGETLTINGKAGSQQDVQRTTVLDVVTTTSASSGLPFDDMPDDPLYAPALKWAADSHIAVGTGSNTFSPDRSCSRAEVVTFLWRAAGCPTSSAQDTPFLDVKPGDWFYQAALWAAGSGITIGTDNSHFSPWAKCTNRQLLTMLWRLQGQPGLDCELGAYDSGPAWAAGQGLLRDTDLQDNLGRACLRRDVVLLLYRTM